MKRLATALAMAGLMVATVGCPDSSGGPGSSGPVAECTRAGQQCKMGGRQIGVCTSDLDSDPPRLFCMSQH